MRWWWDKQVRRDIEAARERRKEAERKLAEEQREIIRPLEEMIREDHISDILDSLTVVRATDGKKHIRGRRVSAS